MSELETEAEIEGDLKLEIILSVELITTSGHGDKSQEKFHYGRD